MKFFPIIVEVKLGYWYHSDPVFSVFCEPLARCEKAMANNTKLGVLNSGALELLECRRETFSEPN